jgi:ribosomal protein S27AE
MAHWDGKTIVYFPNEPYPDHPNWVRIDCGCCAGIEWGGESPRECRDCGGSGMMALHKQTGRIADYPGGPFRGRRAKEG